MGSVLPLVVRGSDSIFMDCYVRTIPTHMSERNNGAHCCFSLGITTTPIPGFLRIDLTVHGDNRGWFKENGSEMVALGLPDFSRCRTTSLSTTRSG